MEYTSSTGVELSRGSAEAAGLDLCASRTIIIPKNSAESIPTGISVAIPQDCFGLVTLRSKLGFRFGLSCHVGIIDSDYRGEIMVHVFNHNPIVEKVIREGERFAQLTIVPYRKVEPILVTSLNTTERGFGGFGSTGE